MNPTAEKKLEDAMGCINYTQAEAENISRRGLGAVKWWKEFSKKEPKNDSAKKVVKDVVPLIEKIIGKRKQVEKDLTKLQEAGDKAHDYFDGKEFRDRNKKLWVSAENFEKEVGTIMLKLKAVIGGGLYPGMSEPSVKMFVMLLPKYMSEYSKLKVALNRI